MDICSVPDAGIDTESSYPNPPDHLPIQPPAYYTGNSDLRGVAVLSGPSVNEG